MPYPGYAGWVLQLDPPAVATDRAMLDINNPSTGIVVGGTDAGTGLDFGTSALTQYMTQQGQWGNSPSDWVAPNRTITIPLGLGMSADDGDPDADEALANLSAKVGLIQREGGQLLRQRDGGPAMYADIVDAQLDVPDVWGETAGVEPGVTLTLVCLPDWYGDEITLDSISATGCCDAVLELSTVQAVIEGHYPGRCRIIVSSADGATSMWWALRSRHYSSAATAELAMPADAALTLESGSGFTSSLATKSGSQYTQVAEVAFSSYGGTVGDQAFFAYPTTLPTHLGSYAVLARVQTTDNTDLNLALQWKNMGLANAQVNAPVKIPAVNSWQLVNLGVVNLDTPPVGSNSWTFQVLAETVTSASITANLWLDGLLLIPLDDAAGQVQNVAIGGGGGTVTTEIRTEGIFGQYSSTSFPPYSYGSTATIGDLPRLPPSGLEGRPCELLVRPMVGFTNTDDTSLIPFTVQVKYRPTYLSRP